LTEEEVLSVSFDLKTLRGDVVFGSGNKFECKKNHLSEIVCRIPGNFLNDDSYQISLYILTASMRMLFSKDEFLTFEIKDQKRESGYLGKINGFVRPQLEWRIS